MVTRKAGRAAWMLALAAAGGAGAPAIAAPRAPASVSAARTLAQGAAIAVLPFEILGDPAAPADAIRGALLAKLTALDVPILDDRALERFMREHRVRYVGGVPAETGRALLDEAGAGAILVTSIDLYSEKDPPRLALTSRLVSTGERTRILWMDSAGMAGDQAPGFLGLGRIDDEATLRERVIARLAGSLNRHLRGLDAARPAAPARTRAARRFRPQIFSGSSPVRPVPAGPPRIAVLPFSDRGETRHAGDLLVLQVIRSLVEAGSAEVLEPGVVRDVLLRARLIQEEGPSIPQAELLRALLGADLVVYGEVAGYVEVGASTSAPEVEFSAQAIDTARRQVVWSSVSHGRGDDGVFFFDAGRVPTAHELASRLARGCIERFLSSVESAS